MSDNDRSQGERSDIDDLAEVIRLQAEALARITHRMAGPRPPLPPAERAAPPPRRPVAEAAPVEESGNLPVLADDPALSAESLPVLNAFKRFLEAERRKARRRLLTVTFVFVLLLVGLLAGFLYVGKLYVDQFSTESKVQHAKTAEALHAADSDLKQALAEVKQAADAATGMRRDLTNTLVLARSNLTAQLDRRDGELDRLKDIIGALQIENASMANTLKALTNPPPAEPEAEGPFAGDAPAEAGAPTNAAAVPPSARSSLPVVIKAPRTGKPVQFRLPATP